jgi:hypothetical protein
MNLVVWWFRYALILKCSIFLKKIQVYFIDNDDFKERKPTFDEEG